MDLESTLLRLCVAAALGWLVGLQRERVASRVAGVRTFTLITLSGAVAGMTVPLLGPWLLAAGMLALGAVLVIANVLKLRSDASPDPGMTTEAAALLMYAVGGYLAVGHMEAAVAVGGAVFLLLHFKEPVHSAISALGADDMRAIVQFALVTLIVLPILPDRGFGPQAALNPREIWWMVVLIVSMNLVGYVATKLLATRSATLLAGVVGGAVSSTATTVSVARRSRTQRSDPAAQAVVGTRIIAAAWSMSLLRTLIEVAVVAPSQWPEVAAPLALMLGWMLLLGAAAWWRGGHGENESPVGAPGNPAELRAALVFAALYAVVVLAVAIVKGRFGASALYPVAIVGGLTDTDAVTLSTSNLMARERLEPETAWQLILLAALANIAVKGAWASLVGSPPLRKRIAVLTVLALGGGAGILAAWR